MYVFVCSYIQIRPPVNRKKHELENDTQPTAKRHKQNNSLKVKQYEDLLINERETILIVPQWRANLCHNKYCLLKAIISHHNAAKIFDIVAHDENTLKIRNLQQNRGYLIYNALINWHIAGRKKVAYVDEESIINVLKSNNLKKYGQNARSFRRWRWDQNTICTNYTQKNIEFLPVAGFIMTVPVKKKDNLYTFWMKNQKNTKVMMNYWGQNGDKKILQGKVYVFTCLKPNNYAGNRSLTISGPWYEVKWKWKFDGEEINASRKSYHKAES